MKCMFLTAVALGFVGIASADDKIVVKDSGTTIIINGPIIINGNGNIVQIGKNNKVVLKNGTKKPVNLSAKHCDTEAARHNAQVNAWLQLMKR